MSETNKIKTGAWKEIQLEFHNFKVVEQLGMRYPTDKSNHKKRFVKVECKLCGQQYEGVYQLFKNRDKVCRCESKKGKGMTAWSDSKRNRIILIRIGMIYRCHNEKSGAYRKYGAKGIHVCSEWLQDPEQFYQWAMQNGYDDSLTIDRIDNEKGYSPENCRWITKEEQAHNTRRITPIEVVKKIKDLLRQGLRHKEIARIANVSTNVVSRISCNTSWSIIE